AQQRVKFDPIARCSFDPVSFVPKADTDHRDVASFTVLPARGWSEPTDKCGASGLNLRAPRTAKRDCRRIWKFGDQRRLASLVLNNKVDVAILLAPKHQELSSHGINGALCGIRPTFGGSPVWSGESTQGLHAHACGRADRSGQRIGTRLDVP